MAFMSDADRPRRTVIIGSAPAAGAAPIPVNPGAVRIEPQRRCKCTLARGVWLDKFGGARCELCNLKIREWESS